jgi:hypothetical protein
MKRIISITAVCLMAICLFGCKAANTPLPAGAINAVDAQINANLQAAHAAVVQYEADVAAGKHTPDATEKAVVNKLIASLNFADPLYQNYHAQLAANPAAGEPQQLADALTDVSQNLSAIQSLVQAVK